MILRLLVLGVEVFLTGGVQMVKFLTAVGSLDTDPPLKTWSQSIGIGTPIFEVASTGTSTTRLRPKCEPLAVANFSTQSSLSLLNASLKGIITLLFYMI
ncbi:hypothetical protein N39L_55390 [Limnospira platensis NIES-39]|uniref:Uncharacterized protein n=1 Tax=Limnospira platensis NIES-46 TaxID=1236695 RepID=A0A5M3TAT1_LIMPL|nr:hypothetical protein N39L_11510 [Arthrospira platensis NIES-39]GCE96614.1 hypothetical protein NIES46_46860 [Arthrospira platensis NIES-46]BDT12089.1 hypothetical protein N39L_18120 [Arthrospira platensis NIES-39]BDT12226.1 hypothetical protein N39L_19490 [Arthrospira platensis NIES-39]BDT12624.1 hypothetical protein N39L_23470 [Arthrospira platensis NIES-39]